MTEALLHTIWKYKLLGLADFTGTKNEQIKVVTIGEHNQDSGPDFFNSKISINDVLLAGNVEIHIKTSDWLKHNHQDNKAYNNLVLHVVYEHDVELLQNEQHNVSVLELKSYIRPALLKQYNDIQYSKQVIPCGKSIATVPGYLLRSWFDRLIVERLEEKVTYIQHLFKHTQDDYEETLYLLLCRNFGFKINAEAFELLAKSLPYPVIKKYADNETRVEALLYGVAGFLDDLFEDKYPKALQNEFEVLRHKHRLSTIKKESWKFSKTRPVNFPTIRISQLAQLFLKSQSLYHFLETQPDISELRQFFDVSTHAYWRTHYKFDTISEEGDKPLGDVAFNHIIINAVVPFLFFISKHHSGQAISYDYTIGLLTQLKPEVNTKTKAFINLGVKPETALDSQAQIQLYDRLCSGKACIHCNVAKYLLKSSV